MTIKTSYIETPLGVMLAMADEEGLCFLEFTDERELEKETEETAPIRLIKKELKKYFSNQLQEFTTPLLPVGTPFQKRVWEELRKIPKGETRSYKEIAIAIGRPTAFRAVAQANGANPLAIVIPCHRVINSNGKLGGYNSGIKKKEWLLKHERSLNL